MVRVGIKNMVIEVDWLKKKVNNMLIESDWLHILADAAENKVTYEGHLESKERFAIKKYLLIIGKKKNMQVLSHTFTYFST